MFKIKAMITSTKQVEQRLEDLCQEILEGIISLMEDNKEYSYELLINNGYENPYEVKHFVRKEQVCSWKQDRLTNLEELTTILKMLES